MSGFNSNKILLRVVSPVFGEPRSPAVTVMNWLSRGWMEAQAPVTNAARSAKALEQAKRLRNIISNVTEARPRGAGPAPWQTSLYEVSQ